jgi:hypothetical protein
MPDSNKKLIIDSIIKTSGQMARLETGKRLYTAA